MFFNDWKKLKLNNTRKNVVVVGAGGAGREVLEIFKDQNKIKKRWNILGFIDENRSLHQRIVNGYPVIGGISWIEEHRDWQVNCVVAVGDCEIRRQLVEKLTKSGAIFCNAIHPSVIMSESVQLGHGVIISAGSVLTVNIQIDDHVYVNINSTICHDAKIGKYCTINPLAKINGNNALGEGVYVGTGATFIQGITVGDWTTVGAGAVVIRNIQEGVVAVGVPAKVIKNKEIIYVTKSRKIVDKAQELETIY